MDIKLQVVINGIPHDLSGIAYMSIDTDNERDLTIESSEEGLVMQTINLTIEKSK